MRQPTEDCLLCRKNKASQKKSHIIPKFFGQGLFDGTNPKQSVLLTKEGKRQKVQDIFKEDHLFCVECEKGFNTLETYCYLRLERYDDYKYNSQFKHFNFNNLEYIECNEIDIKIFNLFIYSIIWRISISEHYGFKGFKLSFLEEEKLRIILNENSSSNQEQLFLKINKFNNLPEHSHVMIRPKKRLRPPSSMLSAASYNEVIHQIHLVDYIIIYLTNNNFTEIFRRIDNNRIEGNVRIGLVNKKTWENFNMKMISETLNK